MPQRVYQDYVWDERMHGGGRYRRVLTSGSLGRLVSRETVLNGLRTFAARSSSSLADLARALRNNEILPADAQRAGEIMLKDLHNAYAALARGGFARLDDAAYARTSATLVNEYRAWQEFMRAVAAQELTEKQIRARAALYVGKAYARYWQEDRLLKLQRTDLREERWLDVRDAVECDDCPTLADLDWVPLGTFTTVPGAGDTRCLGNCRCALAYR